MRTYTVVRLSPVAPIARHAVTYREDAFEDAYALLTDWESVRRDGETVYMETEYAEDFRLTVRPVDA